MAVAQDAKQPILFERDIMKVVITIVGELAEIIVTGKDATIEVETEVEEPAQSSFPHENDEDETCAFTEGKICDDCGACDDVADNDEEVGVASTKKKKAGQPKLEFKSSETFVIKGARSGRFPSKKESEVGKHRISSDGTGKPNCLNKFWFGGHACGDSGNCDYVVGCRASSKKKE